MSLNIFELEEYLSKYEFAVSYLLCCSDSESFAVQEILDMALPPEKTLWDNLRLSYTQAPGLSILREQIARSLYPTLNSENILCFAGAEEGIFCALHTLCEAGDNIITLTPAYQSLIEIPKLKGAEVTCIPLREENQWRINLDEIKQAIKPKTKCIVINFPHNPTGQVITKQDLIDLIALCKEYDLWLFSDEVYHLLGKPQGGWVEPAAQLYSKALSLGVMSKAFGMAGLRIGWIACQDKQLLKKIEYMKYYTSICNSGPSEIISLIALKNMEQILSRNNGIVATNLNLLDSFIEEYRDFFEWIRPQGGCIGFVKYKGPGPVDEFTKNLLEKKSVLLMPASIYHHQSNHFRVGFGRKNMPEALNKLKEFMKS